MRWADVAPRAWRLGEIVDVTLHADETWLRAALDALLENAVQHTDDYALIELSARGDGDDVVISRRRRRPRDRTRRRSSTSSSDSPARTPPGRGARAAPGSASRSSAAIARAHGGSCAARNVDGRRRGLRAPAPAPARLARRARSRAARRPEAAGAAGPDLLESTGDRALPQVPPPDLRGGGRAGGGRADAHERDRAGQGAPGVPVRRAARHGQDVARPHPREGGQLRARPDRRRPTAPATRASRSRTAPRST